MKYTFIIFFKILLVQPTFCQENDFFEYHKEVNKAQLKFFENNYKASDSIFTKTFKEFKNGFPTDYLFAANNALKFSDLDQSLNYILNGFKNGLVLENLKKDSCYQMLKHEFRTRCFKKKYKLLRKEYVNSLDIQVRKEIYDMVKMDQKYRNSRFSKKPWSVQQSFMKRIDSLNFDKLLDICNDKGFPGSNLVGNDDGFGLVDVAVLLRHMDSTRLKKLEPYILVSIKNGHFMPFDYVSALDYSSMFKTTVNDVDEMGRHILIIQQKYGTITGIDNDTLIIYPVENLIEIDELRSNYGLESIADYAFKKGCKIPMEGFFQRVF